MTSTEAQELPTIESAQVRRFSLRINPLIGLGIGLIVLSVVLSIATDGFFTAYNLLNIFRQISLTSIMAVGFGITVLSGGMDISLGNVAALTGMTVAWLVATVGVSLGLSLLLALSLGTFVGLINGVIIAYLGVPPFITTLAMMFIAQGITFETTRGYPIYEGMTREFLFIGQGYIGPIPFPVVIMAALFVVAHLFLSNTKLGQYIYAIGGNEEAARYTGVNVKIVKTATYGIAGFCAALTGVVMTSRLGSGQPAAAGMNFFLTAATAAILGGIDLKGGIGNMLGVFVGALFLGVLSNGLTLLKVSAYMQWIVMGIILVAAIVWNSARANRGIE
ncbi:MAG: ABC transporter permease [Firmicutes bacterium]|nr:ABC transporter permease [Bacillota bacterium]